MKATVQKMILPLLFALLLPVKWTLAHGGGVLQVANAPIASYQVSVWTNPATARAGQPLHVTVGVAAGTGEPVLDAAITVDLLTDNGDVVLTAVATTEQSVNRLFYEADLPGTTAGTYKVQLALTGSEGSGTLSFPLFVKPVSVWPWIGAVLTGAAVIGFAMRIWRKGQKEGAIRQRTAVPRHHSVD